MMTLRNSKEFPIKEASEWAGFSKLGLIFHRDYLQSAYQFSSVDYIILDSDVQPQNQQSCVGSNYLINVHGNNVMTQKDQFGGLKTILSSSTFSDLVQ